MVGESGSVLRALIMCVVDVLDNRFPRLKHVRVRHMVHEQQQIVWTSLERFESGRDGWAVLADEPGARGGGAVVADAGFIDAILDARTLSSAIERGCLCGSLTTRQAGAIGALPSREELELYHDKIKQS